MADDVTATGAIIRRPPCAPQYRSGLGFVHRETRLSARVKSRGARAPRRLLIAGYGVRGRQWHDHAQAHRDWDVVGVADPLSSARQRAARRAVPVWAELEQALAVTDADAVIVASPPQEHAAQAGEALAAGLAVLVEKPLGLSLDAAGEVVRQAQSASRPALVAHNFRHRPRELAVRAVLAGGRLGALRHLAVVSARPAGVMAAHMRGLEHGPLWDLGVHHLDVLRARMGRVPDEMRACLVADGGDGATYALTLRWRDGPTAAYSHREGAPAFHHHEWIQGERAGLRVDPDRVLLVSPGHRPRRVRQARRDHSEQRLLDALLEELETGCPGAMSARDGLATVAMMQAALLSLKRREPVDPSALVPARSEAP